MKKNKLDYAKQYNYPFIYNNCYLDQDSPIRSGCSYLTSLPAAHRGETRQDTHLQIRTLLPALLYPAANHTACPEYKVFT